MKLVEKKMKYRVTSNIYDTFIYMKKQRNVLNIIISTPKATINDSTQPYLQ